MKLVRSLVSLVLLGALGAGGWYYWTEMRSAEPATATAPRGRFVEGPVAVSAAAVKLETVPVYRDGIGNVQASALVTVRPQIDGRLTAVEFREGQEVRAGDVLARIDPASLQAQLEQAKARKAQNEATLANARMDMQRYERLAATNAGSRQQADQQKSLVAQLEAQVRADTAAIEIAETTLGYTVIVSPIDGRTGLRQVDVGNLVQQSNAAGIVTIAQIRPISVLFTLPQRDLSVVPQALARGQVQVEALDTDGRTVLATGRLEVLDNQVDTATGTIKLKALFPNDDQALWPGQFVSVRVKVAELADALTVPTPAIRRGPAGTFVYVVGEEERATVRAVSVVQQDEARAVIGGGLEAGERVITAGFQQLSEGRQVAVAGDPSISDAPPPPPGPGQQRRRGPGRRSAPPPAATPPAAQPPAPAVRAPAIRQPAPQAGAEAPPPARQGS